MINYKNIYYKNNEKIPFEEWSKSIAEDILSEYKDNKVMISAIYSDLGNGIPLKINGNYYKTESEKIHDSSKELIESLIDNGETDFIIQSLLSQDEELIEKIIFTNENEDIKKSDDNKFILVKRYN